jgi:hypothetical protein
MNRPFRFSTGALLIVTTVAAAVVALVARAPAVAMILAVIAVWGSVLLFPDILHWLAARHGGWLIGASLLAGILFAMTALLQWSRPSARGNTTEVLAWCSGIWLFVAAWGYFRSRR